MTVIRPNSISGITSITAQQNSIEFYKSDGSLSGANIDGISINTSGIITANTFYGNGANLTGITGTTINNNADNRIITGSGTANTLNAEANLTYNGSNLQFNTTANGQAVILKSTGNYYNKLSFDSNNTSAGGELAYIDFSWDGDKVADIFAEAGSDTTNKDDGHLVFRTSASQGSIAERVRIDSAGRIGIGENNPTRDIVIKKSGSVQVSMVGATNQNVFLNFGDTDDDNIGGVYYDNTNNRMIIRANTNDAVQVKSDGDMAINDGDLIIGTSGHGIDFSATPNGYSGTLQETLDDYEEGYWTPTVGGWSASGTGVYGDQKGRYTKIGNTVTVFFHIYWTALNNASGVFAIESLPFPHASNQYYFSTAVQMRYVDYSGDTVFAIGGHDYSSSLLFYAQNDNGNHSYVPIDSNGGRVEGCVTYLTDS